MGKTTSLMNTLVASESGAIKEARKDALTTKLGRYVIDTCYTVDTEQWETGIEQDGDLWTIVEQYENKAEAIKGHNKWCNSIEKNPTQQLKDVVEYGF